MALAIVALVASCSTDRDGSVAPVGSDMPAEDGTGPSRPEPAPQLSRFERGVLDLSPEWFISADVSAADLDDLADFDDRADAPRSAAAHIGMDAISDLSGHGADAVNEGGGAAPLPADAWDGPAILGEFETAAGPNWPGDSLDIEVVGWLHPTARDRTQEWDEVFLATVDEVDDWLEPAFVHQDDGIHFGLDFLRSDGSDEVTWLSERPLPDPHREHAYRLVVDAASGELTLRIDGEVFERATLPRAPFEFAAPPDDLMVTAGRKSVVLRSLSLGSGSARSPILSIDAHDQRGWRPAGGVVTEAPRSPRFVRGSAPYEVRPFSIPDDRSWTWALQARFWPNPVGGGPVFWSQGEGWDRLETGTPGWALVSHPPRGFGFAFVLGDGGPPLRLDPGAVPADDALVIIELDRTVGTLSMFVDGDLVAEVSARDLGAVRSPGPMDVLGGYADVRWMAMFDRALDAQARDQLRGGR